VTPEEMREKMKKLGLSPPTVWQEKPIYISSTGTIIDQYVPPEGDGKASLVSAAGAKQVPYRYPTCMSKSRVLIRHISD
jgi:large subunit ribosomal protein L45